MAKPFSGIIGYWGDQGDGRTPNGALFKETFVGHTDEDLREMPINDIRGEEAAHQLDVNGFEAHTLAPRPSRDLSILAGNESEYFEEVKDLIQKMYDRNLRFLLNYN